MKKYIFTISFVLGLMLSYGCDFCNCYLGLNPQYKSNYFGARFSSHYSKGSHEMGSGLSHSTVNMKMYKKEYDIYGQIFPLEKLQIYLTVPYVNSKQVITESISETLINAHHGEEHTFIYNHTITSDQVYSGIGDPVILLHYQLLDNISVDSNKYNFRLLAGGGVKFPVGQWKLNSNDFHQSRTHLPGSGSWDYIGSVRYFSQFKKFGFNLNSNYMFTTVNGQSFEFGNRFNLNGTFLYNIAFEKSSLYPNIGLYYEMAGRDKIESEIINDSGGRITLYHAGLDYYFKNFSVNAALQIPLQQELNGVQPSVKSKFMAGITYSL